MWIKIPLPILPVNLETGAALPKDFEKKPDGTPDMGKPIPGEPWPIQKFMARFVFANPYLGEDGEETAELVWRLRMAFYPPSFVVVNGDQWAQVDASDLEKVRSLLKKPNGDGKRTKEPIRYPSDLMSQFVPFMRALAEAQREDPRTRENGLRAVENQPAS